MSNIFSLSGRTHADARRAKLDVVTAAMLNGGASGGWLMGRALRCASRYQSGDRADAAAAWQEPSSDAGGQQTIATHTAGAELAGERAARRRHAA